MTKLKGKISFFTSGWLNVNMPCVLEVDGDIGTSPLNETDPTVPAWAKESTKPTYTASEVGALPDTTNYAGSQSAGGAANKAASIPYGETDSSSTATAYTATVDGITELRDGVCCILRNTARTSSVGFTLNINNLGATPLYSANRQNSQEGYTFLVNNTYLLVYNTALGGWIMGKLSDENDNNEAYNVYLYHPQKTYTRQGRYMVLLTMSEEYVLPVNSYDDNVTTTKELTTESFDVFGLVYGSNLGYSITAGENARNVYTCYASLNLKYAFNVPDSLFEINKLVYLVCVPQSDGKVKLHSNPLSQALPTTEDGLVYKLLGKAVSGYQICLYAHKPVYYFKDGQIREWTNSREDILKSQKQDKIPIVSVASNASSLSCEEDKYYRLDTAVNTFSITLPTVTDVGIAKSVIIYLTTGATPAITITSTQQLHYSYGFSLEASKTYEINALWNGAAWTITSIEL